MTKIANGYEDSKGNAYCTKCEKIVPKSQIKHELGYAFVKDIHTLVCICVGCFNKRYVETKPASREHQDAFHNLMICAFAVSKDGPADLLEIAESEFLRAAAIFDVTVSEKGSGLIKQ